MRRTIAIPAVCADRRAGDRRRSCSHAPIPVRAAGPPPPAAAPVVPVVAGAVSSHDVPIYLRGVGTVIAYNTVLVRSQIQGQITQIAFTEGQTVKAGDLLAQIDPRPYQAQLDQVTATRDRDQAQLANAQANLDRYTQLGDKGWATPQLVDTQTAQVAQLQSAIKADEALIEAANVQLGYTRLTSPIDGRHRRATGRRRQHHPPDRSERTRRGHPDRADLGDLHAARDRPAADPAADGQGRRSRCWLTARMTRSSSTKASSRLVDNEILQTTGTIRLKAEFPNHGASALAGRAHQCLAPARYPS